MVPGQRKMMKSSRNADGNMSGNTYRAPYQEFMKKSMLCQGIQPALMKRASNLSPKIGSPGLSHGAELRIPRLQAT